MLLTQQRDLADALETMEVATAMRTALIGRHTTHGVRAAQRLRWRPSGHSAAWPGRPAARDRPR
jgi:hypothetical protein